jgi:hypothetical protein
MKEREFLVNQYRNEMREHDNDLRYTLSNFERWMSVKITKKRKTIGWKSSWIYEIDKNVEWEWFFTKDEFDKIILNHQKTNWFNF